MRLIVLALLIIILIQGRHINFAETPPSKKVFGKITALTLVTALALAAAGAHYGAPIIRDARSQVTEKAEKVRNVVQKVIYVVDTARNLRDRYNNLIASARDWRQDPTGNIVRAGNEIIASAGSYALTYSKALVNYIVDTAQNLWDGANNLIARAGEWKRDSAGNIVRAGNEIIARAGSFALSYSKALQRTQQGAKQAGSWLASQTNVDIGPAQVVLPRFENPTPQRMDPIVALENKDSSYKDMDWVSDDYNKQKPITDIYGSEL